MQNVTELDANTGVVKAGTGNIASVARAAAESAPADPAAVDFQNFLKLLTAQLRNQDPLSPLDSTEFVAQLASFSTVEQLVSANQRLDSIASSIVSDAIDQYAPWIGKNAELSNADAYFDGEPIRFRISGDVGATRIEGVITNRLGNEIARLNLQNTEEIQVWDGQLNGASIDQDAYKINVVYHNGDEIVRTETANVFARINEVRLSGDGAELRLVGGGSVMPEQVIGLSE